MEMGSQHKEIEMPTPTTLGYNPSIRDSSSKLSPPQSSEQNHHLYPSNPLQQHSQRLLRDPDPTPIAPTSLTTSTPIVGGSNSRPVPAPPQIGTTTTTTTSAPSIRYRECLKNHAASTGGHVLDGCGEFMPGGEEGTPESLRCAACECHRNFHRKETEGELPPHVSSNYYGYYSINKSNGQNRISSPHPQFPTAPSSLQHQHNRFSHRLTTPSAGLVPPVMMAFGSGGPAESSSEDLNMFAGGQVSVQAPLSKKRFRTKFTQDQRDRMMEFAEKLGWKIQKHDEQEVQQFCSQVGVKRQVFKVWMHNNKQAMKKKQM